MPKSGRRFWLVRDVDVSGVSGIGVVAEGIEFRGGPTVLRWRRSGGSLGVYKDTESIMDVHGHGGSTRLVWKDT